MLTGVGGTVGTGEAVTVLVVVTECSYVLVDVKVSVFVNHSVVGLRLRPSESRWAVPANSPMNVVDKR